ncbi:acetate--CoA ligase family protein [Bacillus sp. ISL-47]|uniref:acetate--CoA ligase family protein n=1 Tax=Bacillus sp. ISL-47 TaxID=2819130 RepID=UPI001BEC451B|nr:acetate--CoA ligase family protein [Bacillus sp. ISL-47]MBT2689777.1 acetate--CoA ligase family protein [Bacillus sp. ISL-47]MBT2709223.1 acetate--CoA ligase family protein [Pseudomonas sp. ISL-84]
MTAIQHIINISKEEKRAVLTEIESKQILRHIGIPVPDFRLARSADEAVEQAKYIGFPLVLKIVSPDIVHKSDAKGVILNIQDEQQLRNAYKEIMINANEYNSDAKIIGVSIQQMVSGDKEVIIGMNRDDVFGPVLLFGAGGIFVEVLKDVTLKVLPLAEKDIDNMFTEIKANKILTGFRGTLPADSSSLKAIIKKVAELSSNFPEISELELNPVIVHEQGKGAVALDARIILDHRTTEVAAS